MSVTGTLYTTGEIYELARPFIKPVTIEMEFEQGGLSGRYGNEASSTTEVRTDFLFAPCGFTLAVPEGFKASVYHYLENSGAKIYQMNAEYNLTNTVIRNSSKGDYIRVALASTTSGTNITPTDIPTTEITLRQKNAVTPEELALKADIANPEFTGSINMGRKAETTAGNRSVAAGYNTTASGTDSVAFGNVTEASGSNSSAFGSSTKAKGSGSSAFGGGTIASGSHQMVFGEYNLESVYPEWAANTHYDPGDVVKIEGTPGTMDPPWKFYECITENTDSTFDSTKWDYLGFITKDSMYVEIVGNGASNNTRSNARTLDWEGNERIAGDLYVCCNADSSGGKKVATEVDVVNVSGSTPSITGVDNTRYICGEVGTISITPPQTGIIDVIFTSGSTPTVLTVPNTVKFPAWFDPESLEAGKMYEINILDGVYGAVSSWT